MTFTPESFSEKFNGLFLNRRHIVALKDKILVIAIAAVPLIPTSATAQVEVEDGSKNQKDEQIEPYKARVERKQPQSFRRRKQD